MAQAAAADTQTTSSLIGVAKGLYIGPQAALQEAPSAGITHVLSVVNYEVQPLQGLCHWAVPLEDCESADLLHQLPPAVTWLERALRQAGSRVLVHCHAGTSRSAAVIVAAIMKAKRLPAGEALAALQARAPGAAPNPGFMAQLELWGEMGCAIEEGHPGYKQFMLAQTAAAYEEQGYVDPDSMAALPEDEETLAKLVRYRCRKCRQVVATERHVIPQEGVGRRAFRRQHHHQQQQERQEQQQADSAAADGSTEQGAIFLEPMQWMSDQIVGPTQGKLYCRQCTARLGSFNWAGISNSRGAWMTPGFQLHLSKLDVVSPKPPLALAGMRFPAQLAESRPACWAGSEGAGAGSAGAGEAGEAGEAAGAGEAEAEGDFLPDIDDEAACAES